MTHFNGDRWGEFIEKRGVDRLHVSCHEHRFKHFNLQYIYPISCKIAKKPNLEKGFAQTEKRYHNLNLIPATERYIAEITSDK